jgi:NADPH:quinone reductase-like Zn-dependent oxidoreductase
LEILPDTAVEIEPRAFGLNFRDVLVALGQLDEVMMGYECNGIVTKIGSTAASKSGLQVGDRVCSLMRGHYATKVQVDWFATTRIPDRMNFEEAASILLVWATAYHSLQRVASLSEGETVLIHAGTGGVGQAAIMLAQHLGAIVYTTVSTPEKRDFLMKKYRTPAGHIFSSRDSSFGSAVMAATNGRGVDVALNSLAGPLLKETWECMAPFGRFVDIGKRDFEASKFLDMSPLTHAVSFTAVDLNLILKFKGPEVHRMLDSAMKLIASGKVSTVAPIRTFALSDIHKAFRYMQAGKHLGKIVITPNPSDEIKVSVAPTSPISRN